MILKILFWGLSLLPLSFQIFFGIKAIKKSIGLKLWQVGIISIVGQIIITIINSNLMSIFLKQANSHDGLPIVGVITLNAIAGIFIVLVIIIQTIVYLQVNKNSDIGFK